MANIWYFNIHKHLLTIKALKNVKKASTKAYIKKMALHWIIVHNYAMNQSRNEAIDKMIWRYVNKSINIQTGIYIMYLIKYKGRLSIIRHNDIGFNKNIYDSFQIGNSHTNPR